MKADSCAVLLGMPATADEYSAAGRGEYCTDYLSVTLGERSPGRVWELRFRRICEAADTLVQTAHCHGVSVYRKATLHDLADASERHTTLIVFAHWKGEVVLERDLEPYLERALDTLAISSHPAAGYLRHALESIRSTANPDNSDRGHRDPLAVTRVAQRLNACLHSGALLACLPAHLADALKPESLLGRAMARDLVDEVLAGAIRPGNRLELFDGLHSPGAIERSLARHFAGEIELAACQSAVLATFLANRRGHRISLIQNREVIDPLPRYWIVAATLEEAIASRRPYREVRLDVESRLLNEFTRHA